MGAVHVDEFPEILLLGRIIENIVCISLTKA